MPVWQEIDSAQRGGRWPIEFPASPDLSLFPFISGDNGPRSSPGSRVLESKLAFREKRLLFWAEREMIAHKIHAGPLGFSPTKLKTRKRALKVGSGKHSKIGLLNISLKFFFHCVLMRGHLGAFATPRTKIIGLGLRIVGVHGSKYTKFINFEFFSSYEYFLSYVLTILNYKYYLEFIFFIYNFLDMFPSNLFHDNCLRNFIELLKYFIKF